MVSRVPNYVLFTSLTQLNDAFLHSLRRVTRNENMRMWCSCLCLTLTFCISR